MTQLFNDRRNVLQWYTFWFAVLIVGLTVIFGVISSVTACLSTRYTYQALVLAREAASPVQVCPPCGITAAAR
jgi:preprotein translocase subunit SecG